MFGKKQPIRVDYLIDGERPEAIGYDELKPSQIPIDFLIPTEVEIDGVKYTIKRAEPDTKKAILKASALKIMLEPLPKIEAAADAVRVQQPEYLNVQADEKTEVEVEQVYVANGFRVASCAAQAPRMTGKNDDYQYVEIFPWQWRQLEFVRRELAPEIGEELSGIHSVMENSKIDVEGQARFSNQFVRELTDLPLRGLEHSDVQVQTKFFSFATRKDGIHLTSLEGRVDSGFAYVLPSGIALYGQEFENKVRSLGLCTFGTLHPSRLDEDVESLVGMMAELQVVLVDWDQLIALEADKGELRDYLEGYFA